jgi:hypothetical protein
MMVDGVTPTRKGAAASFFGGWRGQVPPAVGLLEQAADHRIAGRVERPVPRRIVHLHRRESLVTELTQVVVHSACDLSRNRERCPLGTKTLADRELVLVVGSGGLGSLIERPAQHRRALAGEMTLGSLGVRGVDGDVEPGVPHGVRGRGEPARVSHLGPDGDREQTSDAEVLAQCRAPRLGDAELRQVALIGMSASLRVGLDLQYPLLGLIEVGPRSVGVHQRPPDLPVRLLQARWVPSPTHGAHPAAAEIKPRRCPRGRRRSRGPNWHRPNSARLHAKAAALRGPRSYRHDLQDRLRR